MVTFIMLTGSKCCLPTGVFWVDLLLKHEFQGHLLFGMRQHDLFRYSEIFRLIHDPWCVNWPDTIV